jgi:Fanconi anemia group M protein
MKEIQFLDIFSKEKKKKLTEKPEIKSKVFVDYREKNSLVPSELIHLGLEIEFKELKIGDYIVNNIAIERKTVSDFLSSMINKRLLNQLEELHQYENKLLIIEGIEEQELYNDKEEKQEGIHSNSIRGFLLSISLKHKIPIIFSKNSQDTAKFIELIAKKKQVESSLNVTKKSLNSSERMQFILEGFPGIGPKTAKRLLQEFKSLQGVFNANSNDIQKLIGKKSEIFSLIKQEYKSNKN